LRLLWELQGYHIWYVKPSISSSKPQGIQWNAHRDSIFHCQYELIGSYVPPSTLHTMLLSFQGLTTEYPDLTNKVMSLYTGLSNTGTRVGTVNERDYDHWRRYRGLFKLHAKGVRWDVVYEASAVRTTGADTTVQVHMNTLLFDQGKSEPRWDGFTKGRRSFESVLE
jgi:hypothetical protein